jgi:hypothetical protein
MKQVDIIQAINDPHLFRPLFGDLATWQAWIVFLKALRGLPLAGDDLATYQARTGRQTAPTRPFREAWVAAGVRSGKSFVASLIAVYLACFRDYDPFLARGERAMVLVLAADRSQAQVVLRYVKGFISSVPLLARLVQAERAESIDLGNRVSIMVATCSYRSVRGFTAAAVIADEVAFWRSDDGANPATEVLRALRPRLATIPDSLLLAISSPYARSGPLWQAFRDHHGRDDSDVLCWRAPTRLMNPTISQDLVDRDMALDPEAARSEWEAEFRSDLEGFLTLEALEACIVQGRYEIPPMLASNLNFQYRAFCDPSGGRKDAAALAIAHREGGRTVLDLARAWKAPHDPAQVTGEMAAIVKSYNVFRVTGDRYAGAWPEQEFMKHGVRYEPSQKDKSALYIDLLPLINSVNVELLDNKTLCNELRALERRTRSAGRDLVDHPPRMHDDLANAVAGACVLAGGAGQREVWVLGQAGGLDHSGGPEPSSEGSIRAARLRLQGRIGRPADPGPATGPGFGATGPWYGGDNE